MNYIPAISGAGKTNAAIVRVSSGIKNGRKSIIFQPTKKLNEATAARFSSELQNSDRITVVNGDAIEPSQTVVKTLHGIFNEPANSQVILTTFEAAVRAVRPNAGTWDAIIDEVIDVFSQSKATSRALKDRLLDHIEVHPIAGKGYSLVTIKNRSENALRDLCVDAIQDQALQAVSAPASGLLKGLRTHVSQRCYEAFANGSAKSLTFYHVLLPEAFENYRSCTIMGANFEDSMLFRIWSKLGVTFTSRDNFYGQKPLAKVHSEEIGKKTTIYYLVDHGTKKAKNDKQYGPIIAAEFRRAAQEIFKGKDFIYALNSTDDPHLMEGIPGAHNVSLKAHGINDYRNFHNAAFYAVINASADRVGFLHEQYGISKDECWNFLNKEYVYQFLCRTSLRDAPSANLEIEPKKFLVLSKQQAEYMQQKIPKSTLIKVTSKAIDAIPAPKTRGRKTLNGKAQSASDRTRKHRDLRDQERTKFLSGILSGESGYKEENNVAVFCNEITLDKGIRWWPYTIVGKLTGPIIGTLNLGSFSEVSEWLKGYSENEIKEKTQNTLFNLTEFATGNGIFVNRKRESVIGANAILLDMDSELNCDPIAFSKYLKGIEFICYSSFSSAKDRRRWRVVIPLSRPVTAVEYKKIASELLELCSDNGFPFDDKKKNANDIMYLPGIGRNPDAAFFEHVKGEGRGYLPVDFWLKGNAHEARKLSASVVGEVIDLAA